MPWKASSSSDAFVTLQESATGHANVAVVRAEAVADSPGMKMDMLSPGDEAYDGLNRRLCDFNRAHVAWDGPTLQLVLRSDDGEMVGGARGVVRMGAVEIRGLWLDADRRGAGHGEQIVRRLEEEAKKRGARRALLDTYSFQARGFYERLGYVIFGSFAYPDGTVRYYLQRSL